MVNKKKLVGGQILLNAKVEKIEHYQDNNFLIFLKPEKKFKFEAGQFAMIYHKNEERPFSIASPPSQKTLEFLIKKHETGAVSSYLSKLKKGAKVKISGPYGIFTIKETDADEIVFIAAGTGIAPFRSMIQDFLEKNKKKKITLLFGFRNNFFFEKPFREMEKKYKNFKIYPICSKPGPDWKGLTGRVTEHIKNLIPFSEKKLIYICGMAEMVEASKKILIEEIKFRQEQIKVEEWHDRTAEQKKLKFGWFSFTCCEDSTIVFSELLNDHFNKWSKIIDFRHIRILKSDTEIKDMDVAFVEGAIASERDAERLKKIRKNAKKLIAVGSCAINGMPAGQRNNFSPELKKEIEFLLKKFHHSKKVRKLEEIVKVDDKVPGCPMNEQTFLNVLNKYLKEFNIVKDEEKK